MKKKRGKKLFPRDFCSASFVFIEEANSNCSYFRQHGLGAVQFSPAACVSVMPVHAFGTF